MPVVLDKGGRKEEGRRICEMVWLISKKAACKPTGETIRACRPLFVE